ncbi:MAG: hypothetical protein K0U68_15905 [Gammaproteobacteria bacterium]|nr:hypothetical protein [Gammaproteobacteria bacterium]
MSTEQTLKINIPGANTGLVNIVRAFVRQRYQLVENEQADVCIIDLDSHKADSMLASIREQFPVRPIIGLSLYDIDDDNIVHLKKPFRPDGLTQVLDQVKLDLDVPRIIVKDNNKGSLSKAASAVSDVKIGKQRAIAQNGIINRSKTEYYNPSDFLQGELIKAYKKSTGVGLNLRLEAWWNPIIIFPDIRKVWVDADDNQLQAYCRLPLKRFAKLQESTEKDVKLTPEPLLDMKKYAGSLQPMDAFLWKVAWWNAGGQLPVEISENDLIYLKHWPNITRYLCPDNVVQICAILHQGPVAARRIVDEIGFDAKEVFSLISAANSLGLIVKDEGKAPTVSVDVAEPSETVKQDTKKRKPKNTGLLRRILTHISRR